MFSQFLFVYGTLKSDATNPNACHLHQNAKLIGKAKWSGSLYLVSNYPGAIPAKKEGEFVHGELWELHYPEIMLTVLDEYEECAPSSPHPHEYQRSLEIVCLDSDGELVQAWVYIYKLDTAHLAKLDAGSFDNQNQTIIRRNP